MRPRISTSQEYCDKALPDTPLKTVEECAEGVKLVLDDQADAPVADLPICILSILRHPDAELATQARPLTIEPIGIALATSDPLLINMVENYLGALQSVGLLESLREKWFEDGSWLVKIP